MGCRELDIRDQFRFVEPGESVYARTRTFEKNRYKPVFHTVISNYRYYSPELGRWLSRDPIEETGGNNLYGMVGNNPLRFIDSLGHKIKWDWKKVGKGQVSASWSTTIPIMFGYGAIVFGEVTISGSGRLGVKPDIPISECTTPEFDAEIKNDWNINVTGNKGGVGIKFTNTISNGPLTATLTEKYTTWIITSTFYMHYSYSIDPVRKVFEYEGKQCCFEGSADINLEGSISVNNAAVAAAVTAIVVAPQLAPAGASQVAPAFGAALAL